MNPASSNQALRKELKALRHALLNTQRVLASEKITSHCITHPLFQNAKRIAAYWPIAGEIDPRPLIENAWHQNKQVFLPVVPTSEIENIKTPSRDKLSFVLYEPNMPLLANAYGILEPKSDFSILPEELDLVLVPLVGFNPQTGHRLGMGKGYYDRTFDFKAAPPISPLSSPVLVGLAYPFQACTFTVQPWDIPLNAVCTPEGWRTF